LLGGDHFSERSIDSALERPFRKSGEEQALFFSRLSEDAYKVFWPSGFIIFVVSSLFCFRFLLDSYTSSARHQTTLRLYDPSENRMKNKLCSSLDFLNDETIHRCRNMREIHRQPTFSAVVKKHESTILRRPESLQRRELVWESLRLFQDSDEFEVPSLSVYPQKSAAAAALPDRSYRRRGSVTKYKLEASRDQSLQPNKRLLSRSEDDSMDYGSSSDFEISPPKTTVLETRIRDEICVGRKQGHKDSANNDHRRKRTEQHTKTISPPTAFEFKYPQILPAAGIYHET
jgi:hypothetical protein